MLRRENILITEDYMSKTTSATHFTAPGEIEYFDSSIHFGKESDRVEIQNCNIKNNVLVHCSKEDTYDFETGALIALMKMCGVEKVVRSCNEAFSYETDIKVLRKDNNNLREANKGLQEEVKRLKGESESHWKKYQRNIQKKQDRINELEAQVKASEDERQKDVEYYEKEIKNLKGNIDELFESDKYSKSLVGKLSFEKHRLEEEKEKLQHEYNLCLNSENALKCTVDLLNKSVDKLNKAIYGYKNDLYNTAKRCKALEAENEKLKLDCEKLQHGYNDMIICGGRQNGKQYTLLVELFKKTDQKKVDAAYKEVYNTTLPVWQKEFLNQMYGIYKESKEKTELPRTLDINGTTYRKGVSSKDLLKPFGTSPTEFSWEIKMLTKREQMWGKILGDRKYGEKIEVKVERAFINDFLSEAEDNGVVWANGGEKPTEWDKWESWRRQDYVVFTIWGYTKQKELTWNYHSNEKTIEIDYLPPMRWDLFKKGRLVVKVDSDNYEDFYNKCETEIGRKPHYAFNKGPFTVYYKKGTFHTRPYDEKIPYKHKVINWEDVR